MASILSHKEFLAPTYVALAQGNIMSPSHPLYAAAANVLAADAAALYERGGRPTIGVEDVLNVERSLRLNPQDTLARRFRTVVIGAELSQDLKTAVWSPQKDCIPMRFVNPEADWDKDFSAFESALDQYFASTDTVSGRMFAADACAAYMRPLFTQIGQDITIKSAVALEGKGHMLLAADMSDEGRHAAVGELRPMGFGGECAAAGNLIVQVKPQLGFTLRKLSMDTLAGSLDGLAGLTLQRFLIGVEPQFLSSFEVTCEAFRSSIPWELWLDADTAKIGQTILLDFHNYSDAGITFVGNLDGDVTR